MVSEQSQETLLGDAVSRYLGAVGAASRLVSQQELNLFSRWFGGTRPLRDLRPYDIERYTERLAATVDPASRLAPLKNFLMFCRKEGFIQENLATHIKVRKSGSRSKEKATKITAEAVRLTVAGHANLKAELEALYAQRPDIADELRQAMADKDFRENAPLDAARHRQGLIEARIRDLEAVMKRAEVVRNEQVSVLRAGIGSSVVLFDLANDTPVRYTLVHSNEANIGQGKVSVVAPLGRALVDRVPGDVIEVKAPGGTSRYRLDAIEGLS
ncbi:MAG: hypothetical protein EXR51_11985 [Dehalococcoidia bacterium]|nr:hypothetical protein [Dehalococcoidia bacterium]